jgi:hypothetical protein
LDIVGIIARAVAKIIETSMHLLAVLMGMLEEGLRSPLDHAGIKGWPQTVMVALVPLLTLVAAVKLLHRIIRAVVVVIALSFLIYVLWPFIIDGWMLATGLR